MIEVELKSVVPDLAAARAAVERQGAKLVFAGRLEDRRYDTADRALARRDEVLRLRVYRDAAGASAALDWKGPTAVDGGYKRREELSTGIGEPDALIHVLERLGLQVTMEIDREIWQYELDEATVRFERYPRLDDLVEVEGPPDAIERTIAGLGLPRAGFTTERLTDFVRRYEERTGERAAVSDRELAGGPRQDPTGGLAREPGDA